MAVAILLKGLSNQLGCRLALVNELHGLDCTASVDHLPQLGVRPSAEHAAATVHAAELESFSL